MRMLPRILCSLVCVAAVFSACILAHAADAPAAGKNVVLWISIDGCRGDYVDRGVTPFLQSLMDHGQYTKKLTPVFPSLTFPSHVCEATGVRPGVNGIVSNTWYDTTTHQKYNMPGDPRLLEAEPIWLTATRQGVRTAVLDWPLSQGERSWGKTRRTPRIPIRGTIPIRTIWNGCKNWLMFTAPTSINPPRPNRCGS